MINILIVDDEILIRNKLRQLLDWNRHGFTICKECGNGLEAIKYISEFPVDIVIFDISMPIMNGVELSKYIKMNYAFIKMIAISSYDDYQYVRQVLKNGAVDYLLKHKLNSSDVLNLLLEIKSKMTYEKDGKIEVKEDNYKTIDEKLLLNVIVNEDKDSEKELINRIRVDEIKENLIMVAVSMTNYIAIKNGLTHISVDSFEKRVVELCKTRLDEYYPGVVCTPNSGIILLLFDVKNVISELKLNTKVNQLLLEIKSFLNKCYNIKIDSYWKKVTSPIDLYMDYRELLSEEVSNEHSGEAVVFLPIALEEQLLKAIKLENRINVNSTIDEIFVMFNDKHANNESYQILNEDIIGIIKKVTRKNGLASKETENLLNKLKKTTQAQESRDFIKVLFDKCVENSESATDSVSIKYIQAAKIYIQNHYMDKAISLVVVADEVNITPQYLSKLFSETQSGFVDYINYIRIEKAKSLIEKETHQMNFLPYMKVNTMRKNSNGPHTMLLQSQKKPLNIYKENMPQP